MKNFFSKVWISMKAHKIITTFIVIVVLGGVYIGYKKIFAAPAATQYILGQVERGTLITSVEGTGQVSAKNQLDVLPQSSGGTVTGVSVKQGQNVTEGQTIAVIDQKNTLVALTQAKASLDSAQASYNKLVNGATSATLNVGQVSVQTADQNLSHTIQDSYTQADNLIHTDLDKFYENPSSFSPQFQITFFDSASNSSVVLKPTDENQTLSLNSERSDLNSVFNAWKADLRATSTLDSETLASKSLGYLNQIKNFVNDLASAVNSIYLNQTKYQSSLDTFKSDSAAARSTVDTLLNNIQNSQQSLATAKANLAVTTAPARAEDVASSKASLESAQASYQLAVNNYNNNIIKAPFAGEVAALNVKKGDVISASTVIATLTTPQKLAEITLNEVDVAKIAIGDKATLTFDALPDLSISGTVAEVNSIGVVTQGVVNYTIKVAFDTQDERVLPGMSVSASIITDSKEDVLMVPSSAVKTDNQGSFVQELINSNSPGNQGTVTSKSAPKNVPVEIGISNDTNTEIVSGLNEGDQIIVRTITNTLTTQTSSAPSLFGGGSRTGGGAGAVRVPRN